MRFYISQPLYQEPPLEPWSLEPRAVTADNYQAAADYAKARIMPRFPPQPRLNDGWDLDDIDPTES